VALESGLRGATQLGPANEERKENTLVVTGDRVPARGGDGASRVLIFDVNETLLDLNSLKPFFERVFGDQAVLRSWFGELVMYSMSMTLSGRYSDFFTLGKAVLAMVAVVRGVNLTEADRSDLAAAMRTMPAHPDVVPGLEQLLADGYRLVTLTNSPSQPGLASPLDHAGLSRFFERQFSVDTFGVYKPSTQLYRCVAEDLGMAVSRCMLVAAHAWDCLGAQSAGMRGALLTRPGNAALFADGDLAPTVTAADVSDLAVQLRTVGWPVLTDPDPL
jgi:2-haloacid dehalogenase